MDELTPEQAEKLEKMSPLKEAYPGGPSVEEVVAKMGKNRDMKLAVNWIIGELFAVLNNKNIEIAQSPISAKNLAKLINLIKNGTISGKIAKTIF